MVKLFDSVVYTHRFDIGFPAEKVFSVIQAVSDTVITCVSKDMSQLFGRLEGLHT